MCVEYSLRPEMHHWPPQGGTQEGQGHSAGSKVLISAWFSPPSREAPREHTYPSHTNAETLLCFIIFKPYMTSFPTSSGTYPPDPQDEEEELRTSKMMNISTTEPRSKSRLGEGARS